MNFPQHWAQGQSKGFSAWRWSFHSVAEAQVLADEAARQLAERFRSGKPLPSHRGYYPDRPFREQVLQEVRNEAGETEAVITRNSYGCLVLNTARVMFVDIDFPEAPRAGGLFKRLFGKTDASPTVDPQQQAMSTVETWTRANPGWGWRAYRTRAGLRLLATHGLLDPNAPMVEDIFEALNADPLYRKLCRTQQCFRARLTPKPWRCGIHSKPERWPWLDAKREKRFQAWDAKYLKAAANCATCDFIGHVGNPNIDPAVGQIMAMHDRATQAESKLALA